MVKGVSRANSLDKGVLGLPLFTPNNLFH
jgi:hypothetical protein